MAALATIEDVEAVVCKAVPVADRPWVARLLEMVSEQVRGYVGQSFDQVVADVVTVYPRNGVVRLPQHPVTAVSVVSQNGVTLTSDQYTFTENGYLKRVAGSGVGFFDDWQTVEPSWSPSSLSVTYTHGYAAGTSPADVALVVAEKVAVKWLAGRRTAEGVTAQAIDGYSEAFAGLAHVTAGTAWDPEHKSILDRYRRSGLASLRIA